MKMGVKPIAALLGHENMLVAWWFPNNNTIINHSAWINRILGLRVVSSQSCEPQAGERRDPGDRESAADILIACVIACIGAGEGRYPIISCPVLPTNSMADNSYTADEQGGGGGGVPRDAICIDAILRSMGVQEYEPKVIHQLLEFMYRHVTELISDAQMYQQHSGRQKMDISDIRLAIQTKMNFSFLQPPPREILHAIAQERNAQALPVIDPERVGLRIPPEQYCLTASNYIVKPQSKQS